MIKNYQHFKQVLFHEIGHFVSHQILFEEYGDYESVNIRVKWDSERKCYIGEHNYKNKKIKGLAIPIGYSKIQEFQNILNQLYGCIFQAIEKNDAQEFNKCRNCIDGSDDDVQVYHVYNDYNHFQKKEQCEDIIEKHLHSLLNLNLSEILQGFDYEVFLVDYEDGSNIFEYRKEFLMEHPDIKNLIYNIRDEFLKASTKLREIE